MPRIPQIIFANLTCRFGNQYVLLDLLEEIVLPALMDTSMSRQYAATTYFFLDVGLIDVAVDGTSERQFTVYGRFVKNTVLTRSQTYSPERGLILDQDSMPSAPSSFFALILNNHKLAYCPETLHAPSVAVFASTLQNFLRRKRDSYVRALHRASQTTSEPKALNALFKEIPTPDVEATPMANKATISEFLSSFDKLTHLEFRMLHTNLEIPREQTFRALQSMREEIRATSTKLVHDSKDGLDLGVAADEIDASAAAGNQKVMLIGKALDGAELRGSNDSFKLRVSADDLPESLGGRAVRLVREYFHQVQLGRLKPDISEVDTSKLDEVREKLHGSIEQG